MKFRSPSIGVFSRYCEKLNLGPAGAEKKKARLFIADSGNASGLLGHYLESAEILSQRFTRSKAICLNALEYRLFPTCNTFSVWHILLSHSRGPVQTTTAFTKLKNGWSS